MTVAAAPPPRLFVLLARDAPVALVLRRGPSAWYHLTLWDTARDEFTPGAWFRGRIYEDKCDLSPNGRLLVYAVHQGRRGPTETTDSWTAVSRPPWLHALALWPQGTTYGGGGRFVDDRALIVRGMTKAHSEHPARGLSVVTGNPPRHASSGEVADADWSGRDRSGRLIFAARGAIFARTTAGDRTLVDLTDARPTPEQAPEWARRPL